MGNHRKDYSEYLLTYVGVIFIKSVEYVNGRSWFNVICTSCGREYQSQPTHILDKRRKNRCCKICCDKNTQDYSKKAHTPKEAQISISFSNYKSRAKIKKWKFDLTKEEFTKLVLSNCHYCNQEPSQLRIDRAKIRRGNNTACYLNGLDRLNSEEGYTLNNVVPCCEDCNKAKRNLSYEQFLDLIRKIYEFRLNI